MHETKRNVKSITYRLYQIDYVWKVHLLQVQDEYTFSLINNTISTNGLDLIMITNKPLMEVGLLKFGNTPEVRESTR